MKKSNFENLKRKLQPLTTDEQGKMKGGISTVEISKIVPQPGGWNVLACFCGTNVGCAQQPTTKS